ncbi:MAG TPA: AcvB/VirJ family lysyl-phosphatidylglycerol hydrolase [Anaeromyxobacter sp.]|nr:AcvB/VirJ family lysyl-phosphatidylglycerol hydrolase [Anaeromyxobacter sp.]
MIALVLAVLLSTSSATAAAPRTLELPGVGIVEVDAPEGVPRRVAVLLSGEGGLRDDGRSLAAALSARGTLVLSLDTRTYLARRLGAHCAYPAGDLESLAQRAEKALGLPEYRRPFLVGHALGAAAVWAALAQAPEGTFAGGVELAPCPGRPLGIPLCAGAGPEPRRTARGDVPADGARASAPLAIVSGAEDRACPASDAVAFGRGRDVGVTVLPGIGHALDPADRWADATVAAIERIEAIAPAPSTPVASGQVGAAAPSSAAPDVEGLPLVEVPSAKAGARLAVLLTGDGGWVGLDKEVSRALSDAGVAVVGLDSLRYFWRRRTPEETAADVARVFAHYRAAWGRRELILLGYSRGADIVPFVATRLPPDQRAALALVAMLGPGTFAEFEVHMIDLFSSRRRSAATSTEAAVRGSGGALRFLCVQGDDEKDSLCPHLADLPWVERVVLPGGHHFDRDYAKLARIVNDAAGAPSSRPRGAVPGGSGSP